MFGNSNFLQENVEEEVWGRGDWPELGLRMRMGGISLQPLKERADEGAVWLPPAEREPRREPRSELSWVDRLTEPGRWGWWGSPPLRDPSLDACGVEVAADAAVIGRDHFNCSSWMCLLNSASQASIVKYILEQRAQEASRHHQIPTIVTGTTASRRVESHVNPQDQPSYPADQPSLKCGDNTSWKVRRRCIKDDDDFPIQSMWTWWSSRQCWWAHCARVT